MFFGNSIDKRGPNNCNKLHTSRRKSWNELLTRILISKFRNEQKSIHEFRSEHFVFQLPFMKMFSRQEETIEMLPDKQSAEFKSEMDMIMDNT